MLRDGVARVKRVVRFAGDREKPAAPPHVAERQAFCFTSGWLAMFLANLLLAESHGHVEVVAASVDEQQRGAAVCSLHRGA